MNNLIKLAVLASLAALPASATWINISGTNCVCTDFEQLVNTTSNTRFVNDYGTVNTSGSGTGSNFTGYTSQAGSQLVGWFASQGSTTANGGNGTIIDTSSPFNSTVRSSNAYAISSNAGEAPTTGLLINRSSAGADEALGMSANDTTGNVAVGVAYRNAGSTVVNTLIVSYRGEQWRNSGASAQSIEVSYAVFSGTPDVTLNLSMDANKGAGETTSWNSGVTWQSAGGLSTFTSPVTGGTAGALNGNLEANSQTLNFNLSNLNLQPDGYVVIRWRDINDPGTDHILAIDDVCVAIPEPSTYAAIIALGAIGTSVWRSRRRAAKA